MKIKVWNFIDGKITKKLKSDKKLKRFKNRKTGIITLYNDDLLINIVKLKERKREKERMCKIGESICVVKITEDLF